MTPRWCPGLVFAVSVVDGDGRAEVVERCGCWPDVRGAWSIVVNAEF